METSSSANVTPKYVINKYQWDAYKKEWDVSEKYMKNHYILKSLSCPLCHCTSVTFITDHVLSCISCFYEDMEEYFQ